MGLLEKADRIDGEGREGREEMQGGSTYMKDHLRAI